MGPPGFGGRPLFFLTGSWVPPVLRDADCCVWNATGALALSAVLADAGLVWEVLPHSAVRGVAAEVILSAGPRQAPALRPPDLAFFCGEPHGPSWPLRARFGASAVSYN